MLKKKESSIIEKRLVSEQVRLLYQNSYGGNSVALIAALLIPFLLWNTGIVKQHLIIWMACTLSASLFQFIFVTIYLRQKDKHIKLGRKAGIFFTVWIAIFGAILGSSGYFLLPVDSLPNQVFIFFFMGGMVAGATGTMSARFEAYVSFAVPTITPITFQFFLMRNEIYTTMGWLMVVFLAVMIVTALRMNRTLRDSLKLKFERDNIIIDLEKAEERFSKAFYSNIMPMTMTTVDDARLIDVNEATLRLFGYSKEELIGKTVFDLSIYDTDNERKSMIKAMKEYGFIQDKETILTTKGGHKIYCLITAFILSLKDKQYILAMLNDITYKILLEKHLVQEKEKAEEATKAKSLFLAKMSHELRTPMNAILGMTNLTLMTDNDTEKLDYLHTIQQSAHHLLTVINDILDYSQIEAGKLNIKISSFDLYNLMDSVKKLMSIGALEKSLDFTLSIDDTVMRYIRSDHLRLQQILINLISNAIKFTDRGGISIAVTTREKADKIDHPQDGQILEFSIADTGIGIQTEKLQTIFNTFTQADDSTYHRQVGTGLGLSISSELIKLMDGTITVESEVNRGSTFSFIIPVKKGKPIEEAADQDLKTIEKSSRKLNILLAEDNPVNKKLASIILKKMGHDFVIAESGRSVIEILKKISFDLILMDVEMPEMDGIEATRRIRNGEAGTDKKGILIYYMSAYTEAELSTDGKVKGADGFIAKPIDFRQLTRLFSDI